MVKLNGQLKGKEKAMVLKAHDGKIFWFPGQCLVWFFSPKFNFKTVSHGDFIWLLRKVNEYSAPLKIYL